METSLKTWRELGNSYWVILTAIALIKYELARENWTEAGRRLAQVEQLIAKSGENTRSPAWASLLEKFHHILAENKKISMSLDPTEI